MLVRPRQTSTFRNRTCERSPSLVKVAVTFAALAAATGLFVPAARAQLQNAPVDIDIFRPAMDSKGFVTVNSSAVLGQWDLSFGLVTDYARKPLQFSGGNVGGMPSSFAVDTMLRPVLQAAVGFLSMSHLGLELGVMLPMGIVAGKSLPNEDGGTTNTAADDREWTFANQGVG